MVGRLIASIIHIATLVIRRGNLLLKSPDPPSTASGTLITSYLEGQET